MIVRANIDIFILAANNSLKTELLLITSLIKIIVTIKITKQIN
jgi:hypothetical protein